MAAIVAYYGFYINPGVTSSAFQGYASTLITWKSGVCCSRGISQVIGSRRDADED